MDSSVTAMNGYEAENGCLMPVRSMNSFP